MIGEQAGNFTIVQKLGEGGMGVVYLAQHNETRRKAAIKVLLPQWTQNEMVAQRFKNEAIAMGTLNHPNIVDVLDSGNLANGSYYLAMEFLDGRTLGRFCTAQAGPLSPQVALQILGQIAAGLEAAHKRGIVHRDLKPENVFLTVRGNNQYFVKLLDWGISKLGEIGAGAATSAGMVAGTPTYMAPEQMFDLRSVDRRSDVYALGVIAYQMITGGWLPFQQPGQADPFGELSLPAIHHVLMHSDPIPPRQRLPALDPGWENAILAALQRDPSRRPQTAKAFVLMLAAATPGDGYHPAGAEILDRYAGELLDVSNLDETVRAVKPSSATTKAPSRYRFGDQLGAGGMAEVFRATQIGAEGVARTVAVKRVLPGFSTMPQFASMFVDEARLASLLAHQNIVSVLDFDRDENGQLFLVMEFVAGRDLAAISASGRLPFSVTIFVISEALRGLGYAHNLPTASGPRGVIHRDVSPQNVLVSWEGAVKVSDFGIAKAREATAATASTMIKGKPQYMSPEQANGMALDGRSDLFAVGIMLWELLTGRRLFEGTTQEVLTRLMMARIPRPSTVAPDVPADLEAVAMRMLAQDREGRYLTAELAIEDLARCANAPRNGQGELSRLLAERFPAEVAARSARPSAQPIPHSPVTADLRGGTTRQDPAPQPTPMAPWARDTTLGSAASQSASPVGAARPRRWLGAVLGIVVVAGVAGTAVFFATRKTGSPEPASATSPTPAKVAAPEPTLTITTEPTGAAIRIDGKERGRSPLTIEAPRGASVTIEVARDGYEAARQVVAIERDAQAFSVVLKPIPAVAATPVDAGALAKTVEPEVRVTKQLSGKGKGATAAKKPTIKPKGSDSTFNPDDAIGD